MVKEITGVSCSGARNVIKQFNQWIYNGHDINKAFIKITHTGDFYTIFYDAKLDELAENVVY